MEVIILPWPFELVVIKEDGVEYLMPLKFYKKWQTFFSFTVKRAGSVVVVADRMVNKNVIEAYYGHLQK